jgi:hypothetical protein
MTETPGDLPNRLEDDDATKVPHTEPFTTGLPDTDEELRRRAEGGDPEDSGPGGNPFLQQNL